MENLFGLGDIILISPMIALFLFSLIPVTVKVLRGNQEPSGIATLMVGLAGLLTAAFLVSIFHGSGKTAFANALIFDGLSKWMALIAILGAAGSLLMTLDSKATSGNLYAELVFLFLNSVIGILVLVAANDLLTVFVGLEVMSLSIYVLIGISHEQKLSKEAAFKYFVLGSFASALFLLGVSFIFASVGSTYLPQLTEALPNLILNNRLFTVGFALILLGFCFKVSVVPFHAWTPDVYQGAPTPHTSYMATAVKVASFGAFMRVVSPGSLVLTDNLLDILQWLAVITMLVGNFAAIIQDNLKRVLAYSSIAHSGYLMIGLITMGYTSSDSVDPNVIGASSVIFYLAGYTIMSIGAFGIVSYFEKHEDTQIKVSDLSGLARKKPWVALSLTACLLSLAGIPPMLGFFGKFFLFTAALGQGLNWLVIWGVINSVIAAYYYLRPIVVMYMMEPKSDSNADFSTGLNLTQITVMGAAILVSVLGVVSGPMFNTVVAALKAVLS